MRRLGIFPILIGFFLGISNQVPADDSYETRLTAARRCAEMTPVSEVVDDIIQQFSKRLPEEFRADFISRINRLIDIDRFEDIGIEVTTKHFTADELNALVDFHESQIGKSIMKKIGVYVTDIQHEITMELQHSIMALKHQNKNQSFLK